MSRYLVFAGDFYYPDGGWSDFAGIRDDVADAACLGKSTNGDWWHVVDLESMTIVESGYQVKGVHGQAVPPEECGEDR